LVAQFGSAEPVPVAERLDHPEGAADLHQRVDHRRQGGKEERFTAAQYVLAPENEEVPETETGDVTETNENGDQPVIIAEMQTDIETLTVSDAVMRMAPANVPAMLFRNRANGALNMVYVRRDGNIGWIDPQEN